MLWINAIFEPKNSMVRKKFEKIAYIFISGPTWVPKFFSTIYILIWTKKMRKNWRIFCNYSFLKFSPFSDYLKQFFVFVSNRVQSLEEILYYYNVPFRMFYFNLSNSSFISSLTIVSNKVIRRNCCVTSSPSAWSNS